MSEASPRPWAADPDWREGYSWNIHIVQEANPHMRICFMTSDGPAQANADLIVTAVNNYDTALSRIRELENWNRLRAEDIMTLGAEVGRLTVALEKIACRHVIESPLWWQAEARAALQGAQK